MLGKVLGLAKKFVRVKKKKNLPQTNFLANSI